MNLGRARSRAAVLLASVAAYAVLADGAWAHAEVSPSVALTAHGQLFALVVPTEKEDAGTTQVELTPPSGFSIDSFAPSPGWTRRVQATGSGEETDVQRVTWSRGRVPPDEAAVFQFLGEGDSAKTYSFRVRQTYSDGSVVDWSGPESSDTPAPQVELKSSFGGGGGNVLPIVAIALAAVSLVVGVAALAGGSGRRPLA
jgi:uncharacterized protein YcnI